MKPWKKIASLICLAALTAGACQPSAPNPLVGDQPTLTAEPRLTEPAPAEIPADPQPNPTDHPAVPTAQIPVGSRERSGKIVFTCQPGEFRQLCLIDANGGGFQRLTDQQAHDQEASLSSDGSQLVFVSDLDGFPEIYLRDLKSGEERRLTERIGQVRFPKFSPDAGRVVFALAQAGEDWSIWTLLVHDSLARPLVDFPGQALAPAWSPDGQWLAFRGRENGMDNLYLVSLASREYRQLTENMPEIDAGPDWSPDGGWLVFSAGWRNERDIYLYSIQDGAVRRLTFGGNNSGPHFFAGWRLDCFLFIARWRPRDLCDAGGRQRDHPAYR
ncbi:MAG: DPP IV N-terminal domain-containing protein [Anaerolineales bacterium]|nr:DPP IV N-terminal domain-containing protein [Anaerolineales bacterium]